MDPKRIHTKDEDLELIKHARTDITIHNHLGDIEKKEHHDEDDKRIEIDTLLKKFENGYKILINEIEAKAKDNVYVDDEEIPPLSIDSFKIDPTLMKTIKTEILQDINVQKPFYLDAKFNSDVLLAFYDIAVRFCENAKYDDSIDAFQFLTIIDPHIQSFWVGLGAGYEKNQNFIKAMEVYEKAVRVNPSNFMPFYGLIRCSEELKDFTKCRQLLNEQKNNAEIKEEVEDAELYIQSKK